MDESYTQRGGQSTGNFRWREVAKEPPEADDRPATIAVGLRVFA
jgi:hypothetical protein